MPIYEYKCQKCGHQFEALVRKNDTPTCEACGASTLERLVSLPYVKSETTKARAMKAAKERDLKQATERVDAQKKYEESHEN